MELKKEFGKRIREIRKSLSLSQEEFAEKIDISRNSVSRIENGETFASAETIEAISKAFNISYREIFSFSKPVKLNSNKILIALLEKLKESDAKFFIKCIEAYITNKK